MGGGHNCKVSLDHAVSCMAVLPGGITHPDCLARCSVLKS